MAVTSFPKSSIKILLLENIHPVAAEAFAAEGFQIETVKGALSEAELVARIADVHVLGIRSKTRITAKVLEEGKRLLAVGAFCIGTNQIDLAHGNKQGIPAFNAPFSNTRSVAELILAEIVMLSRHLGDRVREVHAGKWRKVAVGSHEVRGHTIGIVGYGHYRAVARSACSPSRSACASCFTTSSRSCPWATTARWRSSTICSRSPTS